MLLHKWGIFSSSFFSFSLFVPPLPQPGGPCPSLEAQIPVLRPKSHDQGPNPNPKAGEGGVKEEEEEEEEEEKIPHMFESIGHRPLRGRCAKKRKKNIEEKGLDHVILEVKQGPH